MTDILGRTSEAAVPGYRISRLRDPRVIEARLSDDRVFSAYALAYLEPDLFRYTEYWSAEGQSGHGLVMHSRALGAATVTVGDPEAVRAIMSLHPGARLGYLSTGAPEHLDAVDGTHLATDPLRMVRMSTTALTFVRPDGEVRRLRGRDATRINSLYAMEGPPTRYSEDTVERSIYYGAFMGDRLVSVAGTHVVSPHQSIAVVGNVFTHPHYRGQGLAERVTGAVTDELLMRGTSEVVLTVNPENAPAVAAYTRLGYRRGSAVVEARLQRRDLIGISPWWRRLVARHAGESDTGHGIEWVRARARKDHQ
jgi:ribosomal protein S18 acetylase RimI-like enzyme